MLNTNHIVKSYDKALKDLEESIISMSSLAKNQLSSLYLYLSKNDTKIFTEILANDQPINLLDQTIINSSINILSLRNPVSYDLRFVFASGHISKNIARIGDNVLNIAKSIHHIHNQSELINNEVLHMIHILTEMLLQSQESLFNKDLTILENTIEKDIIIDFAHKDMIKLVLNQMKEHNESIDDWHYYLLIARALERIGDHIVNICKQIYFIEKNELYFSEEDK
jgi:phosphate transport system protein